MTKLLWDLAGQHRYEAGVDHGVLYKPDVSGAYVTGFSWNGLTTVTESPTGAEPTPLYADNIKYLNLTSVEEFGGTIEAYTYPDEFAECDGSATPQAGVTLGQQPRKMFGFSYRTRVGSDTNSELGYKLHLVYGATASPSEKAFETINDSPSGVNFSWDFTTIPTTVTGYKPLASMTIDSTKVGATPLGILEDFLYGTSGTEPSLPTPDAVIAIFAGTVTQVTPTVPTYDSSTDTITIPSVTGVIYKINGLVVTGSVVITQNTVVNAYPAVGYKFPTITDSDWLITFA